MMHGADDDDDDDDTDDADDDDDDRLYSCNHVWRIPTQL